MADIWLAGFERMPLGLPGVLYDDTENPKCLWHSTEGHTIEDAVASYRPYPPQLIVDPARKRKVQHIPLNRGGYSLANSEADDEYCVQVEVVGFAEKMPDLSDEQLRWLGEEVARPLHEVMGVPYVVIRHGFRPPGGGIVLARADSPIRISLDEMRKFAGHMAHQHVPGDDHWDIGGLPINKILTYASATGIEEDDMLPKLIKAKGRTEIYEWHHTPQGPRKRHIKSETELIMLRQAYGEARVNASITEFNLAEIQAMPDVLPIGTEVWNTKVPTAPGDSPKVFVQAHQLAATINQNTAPIEASK